MAAFAVSALWRYPVKSMAGENLEATDVTSAGVRGDRAYALVDRESGKVGTAKSVKRFGGLLKCRAEFVSPPEPAGMVPPVRITLEEGSVLESGKAGTQEALAEAFGSPLSLHCAAPEGLMLEFAAGTLGGKYAEATEAPIAGASPPGALFDYACIHIVTSSTLRRLQDAYPTGKFAVERFRPNIVVDSGNLEGFVENSWVGSILEIGEELVLRVSIPCPRCVMTTLPRVDLPLDPGILRTAARLNTQDLGDLGNLPCVGIYADVVKPGRIRRGDAVRVID